MVTSHPRRSACVAVLAFFLAIPAASGPPSGAVSQESGEGLHTARLETAQGSIHVYLPDDLAAGDTISGTVSYTPSGKTEAERKKNLGELRGVVVDVAERPVADGPTWTRVLSEVPRPTVVRFRTPRGRPIGEAPIPTAVNQPVPPGAGALTPTFEIPTFGQAGHPVEIGGRFSGDAVASGITIGGHEAPFLAQSPRKTLARVPSQVVGPTEIQVEQEGTTAEAPFRVLLVNLSADKLDLQRGERTKLHLEVRGLEGLDAPVPLTITNRSPHVVQLGESEVEQVRIQPEDVTRGGTYSLERPIQSLRTGGFAVNALAGPAPVRPSPATPAADRPDPVADLAGLLVPSLSMLFVRADEVGPVLEALRATKNADGGYTTTTSTRRTVHFEVNTEEKPPDLILEDELIRVYRNAQCRQAAQAGQGICRASCVKDVTTYSSCDYEFYGWKMCVRGEEHCVEESAVTFLHRFFRNEGCTGLPADTSSGKIPCCW